MSFSSIKTITLDTKSILRVPLQSYDEFYFIINQKKYKTTRIISDLLSQRICQIHQCDPTYDSFEFTTQSEGDFSIILDLVNFQSKQISIKECPFISEVCEILGNEFFQIEAEDITIDKSNVFDLLQNHLKSEFFYSKSISREIDFISSNMFDFIQNNSEQLMELDINIIERLIDNPILKVKDEDQLLIFINKLYCSNPTYSKLYTFVIFQDVNEDSIMEFLNIYNINDIDNDVWHAISNRLKQKIDKKEKNIRTQNSQNKKISTNIFMKFIQMFS